MIDDTGHFDPESIVPRTKTIEPQTLTFTVTDLDTETAKILFGHDFSELPKPAEHSLVIDTPVTYYGGPTPPVKECGISAALRFVNYRRRRAYLKAHAAWVAEGRPTREGMQRVYFPRVRFA